MRPCNPVNRFLRSLKSLTKRRVLKETNMLSLQNLSCFPYLLTHTMLSIWLILALCYMHVQVAFHIWKFVHCIIFICLERDVFCQVMSIGTTLVTRGKTSFSISLTSSQKKIYYLSYSIDLYTYTFSTRVWWITKDQWGHSNQ